MRLFGRLFSQNQSAEDAGVRSQAWWADKAFKAVEDFTGADVAVEKPREILSNEVEEVSLLHHAAAEQYAARRERADPRGQCEREVVRFECPSWVIGGQFLCLGA